MNMPLGMPGWLSLFFVIGLLGTWAARRYSLARRLLDHPDGRRSHAIATPRGGGVSVVVAMLCAMALLAWQDVLPSRSTSCLAAGLALVAVAGWIDDHRPLSAWVRLGAHAIAAILLGIATVLDGGPIVSALVYAGVALVLVNAWNFMDGINGLAASQAMLVAVSFATISVAGSTVWLCLALAAACLGFLPFNFPRARVFLGDVGSGALGYMLAMLAATGAAGAGWERRFVFLLPLSAMLVDATLTLGARIVRGERWWTPHVDHLYQRLSRRWGAHAKVTLAYGTWTLATMALAHSVHSGPAAFIMPAVFTGYLIAGATWISTRKFGRMPQAQRQ